MTDVNTGAAVGNIGEPNMDNGTASTDLNVIGKNPDPINTPKTTVPPIAITIPQIAIDPTQANNLGTAIGDIADSSLTPAGRAKLYSVMTKVNTIAAPVYAAGASLALFVGGQYGIDIAIGTGVLGVANSIVTAFTTKLAKANVTL